MQPPRDEKNHLWPAPCRRPRRLLGIVCVASMLILLATMADLIWRTSQRNQAADRWMQALDLSAPAVWTAGSPMRHPELLHPGVDLRFAHGLIITP
ncbi:MAG: hypothetical protein PVH26_04825 [Desulfosarcina sp.]